MGVRVSPTNNHVYSLNRTRDLMFLRAPTPNVAPFFGLENINPSRLCTYLDSKCDPATRGVSSGTKRKLRKERKGAPWLSSVRGESPAERSSQTPGTVHFVGIGGSGLSALALLALKQGWRVSGSDMVWSEQIESLQKAGARAYVGHNADLMVPKGAPVPDALVVSSAVGTGNEEVDVAHALGVVIYKRDAWLGKLTEAYELLAVAGTHDTGRVIPALVVAGKSTTVAMLALALRSIGDDITAIVGAQVPQFPEGGNAVFGTSNRFVLEADEYDSCFLGVSPSMAVVTNVEWEHVDMFPDEAAVRDLFRKFVMRIKPGGLLVVNGDSAAAKSVAEVLQAEDTKYMGHLTEEDKPRVVTFGLGEANDWRALMVAPNAHGGTNYVVVLDGRAMARVSLRLPGTYNVLNSLAVIVVISMLAAGRECSGQYTAEELTAMEEAAEATSKSLGSFTGVRRRFEYLGSVQGCDIIDDYAHHPTEVRAVLQGARQRFDQQPIWVVFQPHTFSRLSKLLADFAPAFSAADRVIVTEVYAARSIPSDRIVSGADLAKAISGPPAVFIPDLEGVVEQLSRELAARKKNAASTQGNIVLLTLGAGDITTVGPQLLKALSVKSL